MVPVRSIFEVFRSTLVAGTVFVHSEEKTGTHEDLNPVPTSSTYQLRDAEHARQPL